MKQNKSSFKWRHFEPTIILLCVRWYCRYQLSYRDVEEMMHERGLDVDHSTVFRWVQRYAPEINKRIRQHLTMSGTSYRVDETYIKVGKSCKYLYRAVDTAERTLQGIEAMNMIRKGQLKRIGRDDAQGQAKFVESLFQIAA
jgi:IS6 family transposase